MKYDYLIVGAGLFGSTFAHLATKAGKKCLVVEKRCHSGGNLYCENIEGINVHRYGAHIFHTSDRAIWDWVNALVPFNRFTNSPVAKAPNGKLYNLPFNMNTFHAMWGVETPEEAQKILDAQRNAEIQGLKDMGVNEPRNLEEQALCLIGRDVYEQLVEGYTEKQWGRKCKDLPAYIIRRLPVRLTYDNNYFNDLYQGIPIGGYNALIDKLLEGVDVVLDCDYLDPENREKYTAMAEKVVYTGPIDAYFGYKLGKLDWRTVEFEDEMLHTPNHQGNAVVNYTSAQVPYTRIIEHKHFEMFGDKVYQTPVTVISKEYPKEWGHGMEPYYPVNDVTNTKLYEAYRKMAEETVNVIFGGRLAEYRYYDMAPTIAAAFSAVEREGLQ